MPQINGSSSKNNYGFYAIVSETIPADYITTNETIIDYTVYVKNNGARFNSGGWTKNVKIDGGYVYNQTNQTINSSSVGFNQALAIMSGSFRVKHTDNGSKVITFEACIEKSSYTSYDPGRCYLNGTIQLTTIPRASTVYTFIGNPGYTTTINVKSASQSFRHNITYNFQGLTGTVGTNVVTSAPWEIPNEFYEKIPTRNGATGTIYCETFDGATKIGSTTSTSFTIAPVESDCIPEILASIGETDEKLIALSNNLIKFVSKPKIVMVGEAKNHATITETKVVCGDGKQGTGSVVVLDGVESGEFTISVTDSRGYISSEKMIVEMVPYIKLTLNTDVYRPETTGSVINVKLDGNFYNGNFGKKDNTLSLKFRFKKKTDNEYPEDYTILEPVIGENNTYSLDTSLGENFDYKEAYDFEFIATDEVGSLPVTDSITKAIPIKGTFEHFLEYWGIKSFEESEDGTKLIINKNIVVGDTNKDFETILNTMITEDSNKNVHIGNSIYLPETTNIYSDNKVIFRHDVNNNTVVAASSRDGTDYSTGTVIFRPNGLNSVAGQSYLGANGNFVATGNFVSNNFYNMAGSHKATMSSNVSMFTIQNPTTPYLEVQTQYPIGSSSITAFGVDIWPSDKRLKKSIKDTKVNALNIIAQMKHYEFKYKSNNQLVKIGYVADELEEIDEQLIFEVGEDKLKQPSTSYIIPILSKSIQEQQEQINELKKEIEMLKIGKEVEL